MSSDTRPTISVIVVNFNSGAFLGLCIDRIRKSTTAVELIVVDNCSKDASKLWALGRNGKPTEKYIQNDRNLGFSAAVNIGASVASAELLVVINPDCLVWPHTIGRLCESLDAREEVGLVGGLVFGIHGREQNGCRRYDVTPIRSVGKMLGKLFPFKGMPTIDMTREPLPHGCIDVDAVSGSFFAIRRKLYNELNGLDEEYFLHFEDLDFCRRVRAAGYRVVFNPDVSVIHVGGVSSGVKSLDIVRHKHRSLKIYFRKYLRRYSLAGYVASIMSQLYLWLRCVQVFINPDKSYDNRSDRFEGVWCATNVVDIFVIGDQCQLLLSVVMRLAARGYNVVVETKNPQSAPKIPQVSWVEPEYRAKLPAKDYYEFDWILCLGSIEQLKDFQKCFVGKNVSSQIMIETEVGVNVGKQMNNVHDVVVMDTSGDWIQPASVCLWLAKLNLESDYKLHKNKELEVSQRLDNKGKSGVDNYQLVHVDDISGLCLDVIVGVSSQEADPNAQQILKDAIDRFNQHIRPLYN